VDIEPEEEWELSIDFTNLDSDWKALLPSEEELLSKYPTCLELKSAIVACYCKAKLGGDKAALVHRLRGLMAKSLLDPGFALRVLTSVEATGKSEIMEFHSKTFNYVDRLDLMLSFLQFPTRFRSPCLVVLIYLQRLAEVQCHSYVENEKWDWQGFDLKRYHKEPDYRKTLYQSERKSIRLFHEELVNLIRNEETGLKERYIIEETRKEEARKARAAQKAARTQKPARKRARH